MSIANIKTSVFTNLSDILRYAAMFACHFPLPLGYIANFSKMRIFYGKAYISLNYIPS